jgi:16S rRNA U1498 N3-methylase RsmE
LKLELVLLKAAEMGANAIIINNISRVQSGISIAAVAIRTE